MVCDTPSSQDAFTHQIWDSYLKNVLDMHLMQYLETRSEVKFKVTVTQLWYVTLCHPKMHHHTNFEFPTDMGSITCKCNRLQLKLLWNFMIPDYNYDYFFSKCN